MYSSRQLNRGIKWRAKCARSKMSWSVFNRNTKISISFAEIVNLIRFDRRMHVFYFICVCVCAVYLSEWKWYSDAVLISRTRIQMVMEMDPSHVNHSSIMCVAARNLNGMHRRLRCTVIRPWSSTLGTKCSWVYHEYPKCIPRMVGASIPISQLLSKWIKEQKPENSCEFPEKMHIQFECVKWAHPTKTLPNIKHSATKCGFISVQDSTRRKIINIETGGEAAGSLTFYLVPENESSPIYHRNRIKNVLDLTAITSAWVFSPLLCLRGCPRAKS